MPEPIDDFPFLTRRNQLEMMGYLHAGRRVVLQGTIEEKSVHTLIAELIKLDYETIKEEEPPPITLLLNSNGGDFDQTEILGDMIKSLHAPVDVIALGNCCSMAVDLVQMCRYRTLLPSTRFLVHYIRMGGRQWIGDSPADIKRDLEHFQTELTEVWEKRFQLYERRSGQTREKLEDIFRLGEIHGHYLTAQQSVELGLADEIITNFKFFQ